MILDHQDSVTKKLARHEPDFFFYAVNFAIFFLLHLGFVTSESKDSSFISILYALVICLAQAGTYMLAFYGLGRILYLSAVTRFMRPSLLIFSCGFLNFFLLIDNIIYRLYRFHFNGLIVNVLSGIDGIKSMGLTPFTYYLILASLVVFLGAQALFYWLSRHRFADFQFQKIKQKPLLIAFFLLISFEQSVLAVAYVLNDTKLT